MNTDQLRRMHSDKGFIAALDQSGGSTPKALRLYGIPENSYAGDAEMFALVHGMRTRIMTSPAFSGDCILGAILFEDTMHRTVQGEFTADYLWKNKKIIPFLKVDKGLAELSDGVQLMKPMPDLDALLKEAKAKNIFGTKMRSVIKQANKKGIADIVAQQFEIGLKIARAGMVPILEPEADINSPDRRESESILKAELQKHLRALDKGAKLMFKLSIPVTDNLYRDLMADERVVRVVALSGGYSREEANEKLARNTGLIASFSRALLEGLSAEQTDQRFNETLAESVKGIYEASVT